MAYVKRVNHSYKKMFAAHRFPIDRVIQSHKIAMNDHIYTLVGQQSVKDSSFITNFVVYDETNQVVDGTIAQEIYFIVMLPIITKALQPLQHIFRKMKRYVKKGQAVEGIHGINAVTEDIDKAWNKLLKLVSALKRKRKWTSVDSETLEHYWTRFWDLYEERAFILKMLSKEQPKKKGEEVALKSIDDCILYEAHIIAALFSIKQFELDVDPLDLREWIYFNGRQALASERQTTISTQADKQSHRILVWCFYIVLLGIITPFFTYWFMQAGFAYLFFMSIFYCIYFTLYFTNRYRLKTSMYLRMSDVWKFNEAGESLPLFNARASSINMISSAFFIPLSFGFMFFVQRYQTGWDGFAQFSLVMFILTLAFCCWFPYSPFVEKHVSFFPGKIRAGHRVFVPKEIKKISYEEYKIDYHFYLTYTKEPYQIYIEKEDRTATREFFKKWCETNNVPFKLFDKRDRR